MRWSKKRHGGSDRLLLGLRCAMCGRRIWSVRNATITQRTAGQGDLSLAVECLDCGGDEGIMNNHGPHITRSLR